MSGIVDVIQAIVRHELARVRTADLGVVEAVGSHADAGDHDNYGCDVRLKNSGLLLKRVPVATQHVGSVAAPRAGELVMVAYDKGDVNQPVVIGRLYHDGGRPPANGVGEMITRIPLDAADDETLIAELRNLSSGSPPREALLRMAPKVAVRATDGTVRATAGKNEIVIDQPGQSGGEVKVSAGRSSITIAQNGDITVDSAGALTLRAKGDVVIEGKSVKIEGKTAVEAQAGTQLTLKANAGATLNGTVSATVQGVSVSVKGMTSFSM
ncbi:MAG TPA: phage baseplate assembly protein V [Longimicrobium sp.]|jgi:phage baseplate assembly protein gpV|nr:phage baseplate assembly protein V [Longimicrobium sp.]